MLWEHEPQASVSTAFSSSPKLSPQREKGKQLVNFDYQNLNSLRSRHHDVKSALVLCLHRVIQTRFLINQRTCFLRTVF